MWYVLAAIVGIFIMVILWFRFSSCKCCKTPHNKVDRPPFKTEQDVAEYRKPMKDDESTSVDMEDA